MLSGLVAILLSGSLVAQDFDAFEYRNVGPSRGGRVTAVAGTVAAPSTFYLGASGGGVWKTEDYGTTWNIVSDGYFETPSIGDIAIAQNDANIVYVGTGSDGLRSNVIVGKGMYKSIDGGETWEHIGLRETGQHWFHLKSFLSVRGSVSVIEPHFPHIFRAIPAPEMLSFASSLL